MNFQKLIRQAAENKIPSDSDLRRLAGITPDLLPELLQAAHAVRLHHFGTRIDLCAIINARSGRCSENCAFCAQSAHHETGCVEYDMLPPERISEAALRAGESGASRFSVVVSGKSPAGDGFEELLRGVEAVAKTGLVADVSPGVLDFEQLQRLKTAGLRGYHHNLETAASFFPNICTTHEYSEDVASVRRGKKAGLYVCCGGLFGLGESWEQRIEFALDLRSLDVDSVPVNFLHPVPGTPLEGQPVLQSAEALNILALLRFILPTKAIRMAGGRPGVFGKKAAPILTSGASGLMIGDYLTTRGGDVNDDLLAIREAGLTFGGTRQQ